MQTKLISNVMPIDNDSVVITTTAVDYLHDSIEIFKNKDGVLSDDGYTFNNLVNLLDFAESWDNDEIERICSRYGCTFNGDTSELICESGNIVYFIQCLTAVETHVSALADFRVFSSVDKELASLIDTLTLIDTLDNSQN